MPYYPAETSIARPPRHETGSLRLRVDPKGAKVYIDGALAGVASDFDGLTHHLDVDAGSHQIEFRADGYEPYTASIVVPAGKTLTERASLKKKN